MRVILLNTFDQTGGAARACFRLFQGLVSAGSDSLMMIREETINSQGVVTTASRLGGRLRALVDGFPLHCYPHRQLHNFSPAWMPVRTMNAVLQRSPSIVNLHWIVHGFVQVEALSSLHCPIVWTLHDSWPFTGGCHLPGVCRRYEEACGRCPVLGSDSEKDWSRRIWQRKKNSWKDLSLTVVSPSQWLADKAHASSLFAGLRVEVIPNCIDTTLFGPGDRRAARQILGLPENKKLLLFGANHALSDTNKGFDLLQAALKRLGDEQRKTTELLIFGESSNHPVPDYGLPVRNLGVVADEEKIVQLYRAADVFVVSSRQENFPNIVLEAMSCATPCVAFAVGGVPEMITHAETGYLARPYEVEDMTRGLSWLLADEEKRLEMGIRSRRWVEKKVSMDLVVQRYLKLYRELIEEKMRGK